jgi:hypothetical protein
MTKFTCFISFSIVAIMAMLISMGYMVYEDDGENVEILVLLFMCLSLVLIGLLAIPF